MAWLKYASALAALGIALTLVGSLLGLRELLGRPDAAAASLVVIVALVGVAVVGTTRRRWLRNPYW